MQKKLLVVLVVFVLLFVCCKKRTSPVDYIPKMAGVRHWHGTKVFSEYKEDGVLGHHRVDSVIEYINDTFSITVINNKEILTTISSNAFYYNYGDDSMLSFSYRVDLGHGLSGDENIIYYFLKNKMTFVSSYPSVLPQSYWFTELETP